MCLINSHSLLSLGFLGLPFESLRRVPEADLEEVVLDVLARKLCPCGDSIGSLPISLGNAAFKFALMFYRKSAILWILR